MPSLSWDSHLPIPYIASYRLCNRYKRILIGMPLINPINYRTKEINYTIPLHLPWKWKMMDHSLTSSLDLPASQAACLHTSTVHNKANTEKIKLSNEVWTWKFWFESIRWDNMIGLFFLFISSQYSLASTFTLRWSIPNWQMSAYQEMGVVSCFYNKTKT